MGELGQFALYHQHFMWLPCFCFPAVPHFNNRYLRVTCSTSRTSTATSYQYGTFNRVNKNAAKMLAVGVWIASQQPTAKRSKVTETTASQRRCLPLLQASGMSLLRLHFTEN
jgi:hypothetical protein